MSGSGFMHTEMLLLLFLAPVMLGFFLFAAHRRRRALEAFIGAGLLNRIAMSASSAKRRLKAVLFICAIMLIAVALARPRWNPKQRDIERRGRDVVFLLDVSRSMLAEDLAPNRLERAKLAIKDCVERLQGDRVGIVAFAGTTAVKCPLTLDYGFFRMMLDDVNTESIARGGTMMGDAIRKTIEEVFDDQEKECKDIMLITDGEDHDSFPVDAAEKAGQKGIRLLVVGLGNAKEGRRIPVTTEKGEKAFLTYRGKEVWSKLDGDTLMKMAIATPGGRYFPVGTDTIDLGKVYTDLILTSERKTVESRTVKLYEEKFQIFLALAFVLLCVEAGIGERRRIRQGAASTGLLSLLVLAGAMCLFAATDSRAESPAGLVDQGNRAFEAGKYEEAISLYDKASVQAPESPVIFFNKGDALYRKGDYVGATNMFEKAAAKTRDLKLEAEARYNLGNCVFQEIGRQKDSDLQKALSACRTSIQYYQGALKLDPGNKQAAENIEVVRLTMKNILDEIKKKEEEAEKQKQQQQDAAERMKQLIEKQEKTAEKSKSLEQDKAAQSDPKDVEKKSQEQADEQQEIRKETEKLSEEMKAASQQQQQKQGQNQLQQQQQQEAGEKAAEHLDKASGHQRNASDELRKNSPENAQSEQTGATRELKEALKSLEDEQKKQQQEQQQDQQKQQEQEKQAEEQPQEQEQQDEAGKQDQTNKADEDVQAVLNEEKDNKDRRDRQAVSGFGEVDKDW